MKSGIGKKKILVVEDSLHLTEVLLYMKWQKPNTDVCILRQKLGQGRLLLFGRKEIFPYPAGYCHAGYG